MGFKWMSENFADPEIASNINASSEQAAFPSDNAFNKQRRSKVWRTNGHWEITSANNTLIFEETTGVNLTASVTAGTYSSTTTFLQAVKTALEAVGASTYTVVADTATGKIKITSDGSGGGGILNLEWDHASTTIEDVLGFDDAATDTGALTYTADYLRIHTDEWLEFDFGISTDCDAVILTGSRNAPLKLSNGSTIKIQANETSNWTTPSYTATLTYDDFLIYKIRGDSETGLAGSQYRYWRLQIVDRENPYGYVELGAFFLGNFYTPTRGQPQFPLNSTLVDRSTTVFSEGGQTFSDIREQTREFSVTYQFLSLAEAEAMLAIYEDFGTAVPLFIVLDPDTIFTSTVNRSIIYAKFASQPQLNFTNVNNYTMTIQLREEL